MVEPAGPARDDATAATGGASADAPAGAASWSSQPMPATPPQAPVDPATAPTDPAITRPDANWAEPPAPTTPFFHDVSGYPAPGAVPGPPAPLGGPGSGPTGYPPPGYAPPAYGPPAYGPPAYGYGSPYGPYAYGAYSPPTTNGLAIASMVCGIVGLAFCQVFAIAGLIMGIIARRQIRDAEGSQTGGAFALTGIITSAIAIGFMVLLLLFYVGLFAFAATG